MFGEQPGLFEELREPDLPPELGRLKVSERPGAYALIRPNSTHMDVDYTLNPYIGCGFACSYCYAAFFVADEEKRSDWGRWVEVKTDAVRQISTKRDLQGKKVLMSSATDPYQPLEAKVELTRRIVETLLAPSRQPRLIVQTRSPLVVRDLDLLKQFKDIRVNMSITTDDDSIRRHFEPSCASIDRRLDALEQVAAAGIPIAVCVSPMLPMTDPEAFGRRIAKLNPRYVFTSQFYNTDRPFAANTRPEVRKMVEDFGWTEADFERASEAIRSQLDATVGGSR